MFDAIKVTLETIEELGKVYSIPDELKQWYSLQPVQPSSPTEIAAADTDVVMDTTDQESGVTSSSGVTVTNQPSSGTEEELTHKPHENIITSYIDAFCKVLSLGFNLIVSLI